MFSKLSTVRSTATTAYKAGLDATSPAVAATSVVETYTRPSRHARSPSPGAATATAGG